jgi:hypothetical protein
MRNEPFARSATASDERAFPTCSGTRFRLFPRNRFYNAPPGPGPGR